MFGIYHNALGPIEPTGNIKNICLGFLWLYNFFHLCFIGRNEEKLYCLQIINSIQASGASMILDINYHSGVPIYRQIIDQVREQIMAGLLKEGQQLMPVRELSSKLAVNPMTVSKAYSAMEAEGLLERRRGIGLFVVGIETRQKDQIKEVLIEKAISKAVATAMQFGFTKDRLHQILDNAFHKYQSDKELIK
jgi:GntR family transcriptional regulator